MLWWQWTIILLVCVVVVVLVNVLMRPKTHCCDILNLYFVSDKEEIDYFKTHIKHRLDAHSNVKWYLAEYTNNYVYTLNTNSVLVPSAKPEAWFEQVFSGNKFNVLVYSGHSGGPYLGNEDNPMISMNKFSQILRKTIPRKLSFVWFDSCNMGFLQSLVLLGDITEYVVGAPNYHDWQSVLQTDEIYHMNNDDAKSIGKVLHSAASKYNNKNMLVEMCVYRPKLLSNLWLLYKKYHGALIHDNRSLIEDDYFDIRDVIEVSRGVVPDNVLDDMRRSLSQGIVVRERCKSCAKGVRDSYLAVQKNRGLDGSVFV